MRPGLLLLPLLLLVRIFIASGLNVATIQEADLTDQQLSAVFWLNQALGLAMAAVTAACGPAPRTRTISSVASSASSSCFRS